MSDLIRYPLEAMEAAAEHIHHVTHQARLQHYDHVQRLQYLLSDIPWQLRDPLERLLWRLDQRIQVRFDDAHQLAQHLQESKNALQTLDQEGAR